MEHAKNYMDDMNSPSSSFQTQSSEQLQPYEKEHHTLNAKKETASDKRNIQEDSEASVSRASESERIIQYKTTPRGLTCDEILEEMMEYYEEHDDNVHNLELVLIPPAPDELTDEEDVEDNMLAYNVVHDVAGTLEFISESDELDNNIQAHSQTKRRKKEDGVGDAKWCKSKPSYTLTSNPCKDNLHKIREHMADKTVIQIFEEFFSEELVHTILEQSVIYARQKNNTDFSLSSDELKTFIAILLLTGYHKVPNEELYWEETSDIISLGVPLIYNSMSRDRFTEIKKFIHLSDNSKIDKKDKMSKLKLFFDILKKDFSKFGVFHSELSLGKMIVRYYGRHTNKFFMRRQQIEFGYRIWCLTSSDGFLYNFLPYCGQAMKEQLSSTNIMNNLIDIIPANDCCNHKLFFNEIFTSAHTLKSLAKKQLKATGKIHESRIKSCPLLDSKAMKEKEFGFYDHYFDEENEIMVVQYRDKKPLSIATNFSPIEPCTVKTYSRKEKKEVEVTMPKVIEEYKSHGKGVDLLNRDISLYRTHLRSKKWWWPLFTQMLDICVINTWHAYQIAHPNDKLPLLKVRRRIVISYLSKNLGITPDWQSTDESESDVEDLM